MILCSRCKKRPAVVFITAVQGDEKKNEGLCMLCARDLNIPQVADYMKQMGITDDDIEQMSEQLMDMDSENGFEFGGANTLPPFIQNMLGSFEKSFGKNDSGSDSFKNDYLKKDKKQDKAKQNNSNAQKDKQLKFLDNYCTNLSQRAEREA